MSTASLAASERGAAVRIDLLFLGLALASTAILIALVLLDHQPASAALVVGGFKAYLTPRTFFNGDMRVTFASRAEDILFRIGFGVDF